MNVEKKLLFPVAYYMLNKSFVSYCWYMASHDVALFCPKTHRQCHCERTRLECGR